MRDAPIAASKDHKIVRISTAGSVDDGKSTLIGRLLYDCNAIFDDQYEAVKKSSKATGEEGVNLALLTDGLRAEREQKITIDVAYRYFNTPTRRFIIADTPGHAQYTRNMVTGSSTADVAILLIDALNGMTDQSRRHAFIASLLRVPHVLVAVNKMDLVGYSQKRFDEIMAEFNEFSEKLSFIDLVFMPISALEGDNVANRSEKFSWYNGPSLLEYLDTVHVEGRKNRLDFRFPVQCVIRPHQNFRGFAGQVASGTVRVGEEVLSMPSGTSSKISRIRGTDGEIAEAAVGESVVIELADEIDVSRGCMLMRPRNPATASQRFEAMVCWMNEQPLALGKRYKLLHTTREVTAYVDELVYRISVETLHREAHAGLGLNEIGRVAIRTAEPIFLDTYEQNHITGSFIIVDPDLNLVMAAGMITHAHDTKGEREDLTKRKTKGLAVWLTGLSGAGKSTISDNLRLALMKEGVMTVQIDGDIMRDGLSKDLGFSEADRDENIRRAAEVAKIVADQGLVAVCSFISPLQSQRDLARQTVGDAFMEVHVAATLDECAERDVKGLYARAKRGEIKEFTGISSPYEAPEHPDVRLETGKEPVEESVAHLLAEVLKRLDH